MPDPEAALRERTPRNQNRPAHRRSRPVVAVTLSRDTLVCADLWVAMAPPGEKRSRGLWVDAQAQKASGVDRKRDLADVRRFDEIRRQLQAVALANDVLRRGCDPNVRAEMHRDIRKAVERMKAQLPENVGRRVPEPDWMI